VVLIAVPLALAANVVRLLVTAVLANALGEQVTRGWPHTSIGVATVFVAFLLLYGFSSLFGDRASLKSGGENELVNGSA
jgi:exosortase/archaeosortase family protein